MNENEVTLAKEIIESSTAKTSRPEVYPLASAKEEKTVHNIPATIFVDERFEQKRYQAKLHVDDITVPVDVKGVVDKVGEVTGKLVQLTAPKDHPWSIGGKTGVIKAGTTKAYLVV